jgi:ribonuclease P protein component
MLPAAARMRRSAEFGAAVKLGRRAGRPSLSGHLLIEDESADSVHIGFIVSRSVGGAVVRNRVRRRLRHLARGYLDSLPGGSLLVLRAHPRAATASQADLAAELDLVITALLDGQGIRRQAGVVSR